MILSPPRETYRQSYVARVALTVVALIAAALVYFIGADEHSTITPWIAAAIVAADVAICFAIGKTVLTIHDEGIRRVSLFGVKEIDWRNVSEYRYRVVNSNAAGVHGGLIGILIVAIINRTASGRKGSTNFYLKLIGQDGTKLWVTSSFKNAYDAIGTILGKVHEQLRPAVTAGIAGPGIAFGSLRLSSRDIQWKTNERVPLEQLASAELAGSNLQIKKSGKFFSLVSVRSDKVPNVLLLLEEMTRLGVGAKRANVVDPLAHVRG
jgi:hypothetical protein